MSGDLPFGFSPEPGDPNNPGGGFDMSQFGAMLQQLGAMLQSGQNQVSGPVDWELAKNLARQTVSQKGDPSVNENDVRRIAEAFDLAQLWLDPATVFPSGGGVPAAWSRSEWIEHTWPAWQQIIEPIADGVQQTLTSMPDLGQVNLADLGIPGLPENLPEGMPDISSIAGPLMNMAKRMGAAMFGAQVGNGVGTLADEVLGASDVTIPLTSDGRPEGLVSEAALLATPEERRPWVPVSSVSRTLGDGLALPADIAGEDLILAISRRPAEEYLLVESDGSIFGVLATSDVDQAFRAVR